MDGARYPKTAAVPATISELNPWQPMAIIAIIHHPLSFDGLL